jgi:hypothetical protein
MYTYMHIYKRLYDYTITCTYTSTNKYIVILIIPFNQPFYLLAVLSKGEAYLYIYMHIYTRIYGYTIACTYIYIYI